ncbi:hypothetical protein [Luteitalea sp.]|uniref:hypothetical protein n=1 Tax=Luteitalea sp. TaxID=2004800 RepID=UPI0025BA440D|nr:hypothetical protein [Luteitalea sp.]
MLTIPVTDKTFTKGFTGGRGELELSFTGATGVAVALDPAAPFPDEAKVLTAAKVAGSTPELKFGSDAVACTASFSGGGDFTLMLARAGDGTKLPAGAAPLGEDRLGVVLGLGAHGKAAAGAKVTAPAGFSFGISAKAGANVTLNRYLEFARTTPARSILALILSDIRLPQSRGSVPDLPRDGEVVEFSYSGFLELASALNWGYSLTASEGFAIRDIEARLDYALRAKAALTLGYRLAGDFTIVLTRGHADGWARLAVRKRKDTRLQAAAGFDFTAKADVSGFSEAPNEFLGAFLGTDVKSVLDALDNAVDVTDLNALEKKVGRLLTGLVQELAEQWTGAVIDSPQVAVVLANIRKAVEAYQSIDERVVNTVMELYEKSLGPNKEVLEQALRLVATLSGRDDLLTLSNQDAWKLIQQIVGGDVHALVTGDSLEPFARVQLVAGAVLRLATAPEFEKLRDVIGAAKKRLRLDELFGALEKVKTAQDIRQLRDTTLQGLVERIVGRTFDVIEQSEAGRTVTELNKTLAGLKRFKDDFAAHAQKALHQSVELRINFLYTRATSDQALIDVEIDLSRDGGPELFADAAAGRIAPVFVAAQQARGVLVHKARLTHEVTRSSQLQFNAFGWEFKRLFEVVTRTDVSLQSHAGGLVQVFASEASLKELVESGRKHKERMQASLLLRMAGESFGASSDRPTREYLVKTLERMSVGYDLIQSDDMTDIKELSSYLELGKHLGLVQDGLIAELEAQFGKRLGRVKASYTVRFDHKAVHDAFVALTGEPLDRLVRLTSRRLIASALVTRRTPFQALVGLALTDANAQKNRDNTLESAPVTVTLPGFMTGGAPRKESFDRDDPQMAILRTLLNVEDSLAKRFVRLDAVVDDARTTQRAVSLGELEKVEADVLKAGGEMDKFGAPNTFFGVFDALVRVGGLGKAHRESAMVLEITPPGGETVTRFFMDSPLVSADAG